LSNPDLSCNDVNYDLRTRKVTNKAANRMHSHQSLNHTPLLRSPLKQTQLQQWN
jgi:hypothetical protein